MEWFFTFGIGNPFLKDKFVRISGDFEEARIEMTNYFGAHWCAQHTEDEMNSLIAKFGYTELKR